MGISVTSGPVLCLPIFIPYNPKESRSKLILKHETCVVFMCKMVKKGMVLLCCAARERSVRFNSLTVLSRLFEIVDEFSNSKSMII